MFDPERVTAPIQAGEQRGDSCVRELQCFSAPFAMSAIWDPFDLQAEASLGVCGLT